MVFERAGWAKKIENGEVAIYPRIIEKYLGIEPRFRIKKN